MNMGTNRREAVAAAARFVPIDLVEVAIERLDAIIIWS
jgi:hypothetical protein